MDRRDTGAASGSRSSSGTFTRRPSRVTTTATGRRSCPFEKRIVLAAPARPPRVRRGPECSRDRASVNHGARRRVPRRLGSGAWARHRRPLAAVGRTARATQSFLLRSAPRGHNPHASCAPRAARRGSRPHDERQARNIAPYAIAGGRTPRGIRRGRPAMAPADHRSTKTRMSTFIAVIACAFADCQSPGRPALNSGHLPGVGSP